MYHARIARQVRATHAPLAAKGRPMRTSKWRFAVAHGRQQARSLAERQHPSRSSPARLEPSGFAAERRQHPCRIPTAVQWQHEASRIVNPMIPDLAAAARRLAASRRTHPHMYRSDRTPGPVCACAARREGPSHATSKWRFAVGHGRQQPRSLAERQHPSRSSHERPDPIAHCGRPSKRERVGPTPTRHTRQRTHRFIGVKSDLAHALRSGCRHQYG